MTKKRPKKPKPKYLLPVACLSLVCMMGVTCQQVDDATLQGWKTTSQQLTDEYRQIQSDLVLIDDPVKRATAEARMKEIGDQVTSLNEKIQGAQSGWDLLEIGIATIAGFFPPAGIGLMIVRSLRRQRETIFKSVDLGGGVVNPEAAKLALMENPAAKAALDAHKAANGVTPPAPSG